jgi:hypothetical protein
MGEPVIKSAYHAGAPPTKFYFRWIRRSDEASARPGRAARLHFAPVAPGNSQEIREFSLKSPAAWARVTQPLGTVYSRSRLPGCRRENGS